MTTPLLCGCGATPIIRKCGGVTTSRQWYVRCPVRGCKQSSHVSRATEESTIARWNAEREGVEKKHVMHEEASQNAERCKCGVLLPCYHCPSLMDYAEARQDRGPASGRIRI